MTHQKKKVYCNGVYDLFHVGHVNYFREASKLGELYVGVHSDEDAARYKRVPIVPYSERCEMVASCKHVHQVIPNTALEITADFIEKHKIDIVICSKFDPLYHSAPNEMGILHIIQPYEGTSTTMLLERVLERMTLLG